MIGFTEHATLDVSVRVEVTEFGNYERSDLVSLNLCSWFYFNQGVGGVELCSTHIYVYRH